MVPVLFAKIGDLTMVERAARITSRANTGPQGSMSKFSHKSIRERQVEAQAAEAAKAPVPAAAQAAPKEDVVADLHFQIDKLRADLSQAQIDASNIPRELRSIAYPTTNDVAGNLVLRYDMEYDVCFWGTAPSSVSSSAPWSFTATNDTQGIVSPGLMRVKWEIWDETDLTSWNGGAITVGAAATLFYIEFTITNSTTTAEWKSTYPGAGGTGAGGFPEGESGYSGTPTHIVPILEFSLTASNTISSWTQHQWGNIALPRL